MGGPATTSKISHGSGSYGGRSTPRSSTLPKSNLVCYLCNPFVPPVLDSVLEKFIAHRREGFEVYAIYINPKHLDACQKTGAFQDVFRHQKGVLLKVDPP